MASTNGGFGKSKVAVLGIGYSRITRDPLPEGRIVGDECIEATARFVKGIALARAVHVLALSEAEKLAPGSVFPPLAR